MERTLAYLTVSDLPRKEMEVLFLTIQNRLRVLTFSVEFMSVDADVLQMPPLLNELLPKQYVKIRRIGLMAASNVNTKLARARELLTGPEPVSAPLPVRAVMTWIDAVLALAGLDVLRCPVCGGTVVRRPLPDGTRTPRCRTPHDTMRSGARRRPRWPARHCRAVVCLG